MYYPDLTPYKYGFETEFNVVNVGWLSKTNEFPIGDVSELFLDNLKKFMLRPPCNRMRGWHTCEFCDGATRTSDLNYIDDIDLRNGEVWIPDVNEKLIYAAPTMIWHYINKHNYLPPSNFITSCEQFDFNSNWTPETIISIERKRMMPKSDKQLVDGDIYYINLNKGDL